MCEHVINSFKDTFNSFGHLFFIQIFNSLEYIYNVIHLHISSIHLKLSLIHLDISSHLKVSLINLNIFPHISLRYILSSFGHIINLIVHVFNSFEDVHLFGVLENIQVG